MADGDETARLWKVSKTIHELVKDRVSGFQRSSCLKAHNHSQGFSVSDEEINMSLDRFRQLYGNNMGVIE